MSKFLTHTGFYMQNKKFMLFNVRWHQKFKLAVRDREKWSKKRHKIMQNLTSGDIDGKIRSWKNREINLQIQISNAIWQ